MTQSALPFRRLQSSQELQTNLIKLLTKYSWCHRDWLARELGVSVRLVRELASQSHGEIISGSLGLKLTRCATKDEIEAANGRLRSQISEMTRRLCETWQVWEESQHVIKPES